MDHESDVRFSTPENQGCKIRPAKVVVKNVMCWPKVDILDKNEILAPHRKILKARMFGKRVGT